MPREKGDFASLHDMRAAAQAVTRFLSGKTRQDFAGDEILRGAVERKIEIIGEAARGASNAFQIANPHIPWQKNHGYAPYTGSRL